MRTKATKSHNLLDKFFSHSKIKKRQTKMATNDWEIQECKVIKNDIAFGWARECHMEMWCAIEAYIVIHKIHRVSFFLFCTCAMFWVSCWSVYVCVCVCVHEKVSSHISQANYCRTATLNAAAAAHFHCCCCCCCDRSHSLFIFATFQSSKWEWLNVFCCQSHSKHIYHLQSSCCHRIEWKKICYIYVYIVALLGLYMYNKFSDEWLLSTIWICSLRTSACRCKRKKTKLTFVMQRRSQKTYYAYIHLAEYSLSFHLVLLFWWRNEAHINANVSLCQQ